MQVFQSLPLIAVLSLFLAPTAMCAQEPATHVAAQDLHIPGKGSTEREAILDALRAKMNADMIFVVVTLRVHSGWAWVHVKPQSPDGKRHYEDVWALMHAPDGSWQVVALQCTEVGNPNCIGGDGFYERLRAKFPAAPKDIFQKTPTEEAAEKPRGVEVVRAACGSGPDDVLNIVPQEAMAEGPNSFALGNNGEIYILDQVNSRIQVFRNKARIKTIPIPAGPDFRDISLTKDGKIALLDSEVKQSVFLLDADGTVLKVLPLAGRHVPDPLAVVSVWCRDDGIWVEVEGRSVRISDLAGTPDPNRVSVMGEFTYSGKRLAKVDIIGEVTAVVHISEENKSNLWKDFPLIFDMPIWGFECHSDQADNLFLVAYLVEKPRFAYVAVILDPAGNEKKRIIMDVGDIPGGAFHGFRVSPDGKIFKMELDEKGLAVWRYDP